jgi:hypothetical protein
VFAAGVWDVFAAGVLGTVPGVAYRDLGVRDVFAAGVFGTVPGVAYRDLGV